MKPAPHDDHHTPYALGTPPSTSRIGRLYPHTDLADAYSIRVPDNAITDPEALARFIFGNQAPWVGRLLRVRDGVMARFGVMTSTQMKRGDSGKSNSRISIFRIYERTADEILMGDDDRHLDFRVSILRTTEDHDDGRHPYVVLSTVVHCHNRLGRTYLTAIGPFHRMVVKSALRRAACIGWPVQ